MTLRLVVPVLAPSFIAGGLFGFLASPDNDPTSIVLTGVCHRIMWPLDAYGAPPMLNGSGRAIARSPWIACDTVARGCEVACHGRRWQRHPGKADPEECDAIARHWIERFPPQPG